MFCEQIKVPEIAVEVIQHISNRGFNSERFVVWRDLLAVNDSTVCFCSSFLKLWILFHPFYELRDSESLAKLSVFLRCLRVHYFLDVLLSFSPDSEGSDNEENKNARAVILRDALERNFSAIPRCLLAFRNGIVY